MFSPLRSNEKDEALALAVDVAVRENKQDDWRSNAVNAKKVMLAIKLLAGCLAEQVVEGALSVPLSERGGEGYLSNRTPGGAVKLVTRWATSSAAASGAWLMCLSSA